MKPLFKIVVFLTLILSLSTTAIAMPATNASQWALPSITKAYEYGIVSDNILADVSKNISRKDFTLLAMQLYSKITQTPTTPELKTPFKDIDLAGITFAYEKGIISGGIDAQFFPENGITREQMAIIISNLIEVLGAELKASNQTIFSDIDDLDSSSQISIIKLSSSSIINGFDGKFLPKNTVTTQEAIVTLYNAYEYINKQKNTNPVQNETATAEPKKEEPEPKKPTVNDIPISRDENESQIVIGNKTLSLGMTERQLRQIAGIPDRIDQDSYGFERYVYLNGNADLFFASISNGLVIEIYTGSDNFTYMGVNAKQTKKDVKEIKYYDQKNYRLELPTNTVDAYLFLDHEEGIEAILLRDRAVRSLVDRRYNQTFESNTVKELLDLINQARARGGMKLLKWDDTAAAIASKHSFNMSKNSFVEYNDNSGKTPFDRMTEGGLKYSMAAELAGKYTGDSITIYHEWMRSIGTRSNILNKSLTHGGIGIYMDNYDIYITADLFKP